MSQQSQQNQEEEEECYNSGPLLVTKLQVRISLFDDNPLESSHNPLGSGHLASRLQEAC